jgi:serine/threonine protein phosphatase PrpC
MAVESKPTYAVQEVRSAARSHIGASPLRTLLEDRSRGERVRTASGLEMVLGVVADGIGGENAGERAAEVTVNTVFEVCSRSRERDIPTMLKEALEEANQRVYVESRRSRRKMHMGSTAAVAAVVDGRLYIANVGDSRIYLIHGSNVRQLSMDHTWANEMTRSGRLSKEEAAKHPRKDEIVRSIGYEKSLQVDLGIWLRDGDESEQEAESAQGLSLQNGDRILICSDGVTKNRHDKPGSHYVEDGEIPRLIEGRSPEQAVDAILKQARSRKVDDNVSAVILEVGADEVLRRIRIPRRTLAVGAVILLLVAAGVWLIPGWMKAKSDEGTTPIVAELPAGVAYVSALKGFAEKQSPGGNFKGLQQEEILTSGQDIRVRTLGDEASLCMDMADQSVLYLGPDSQIELRAIADGNSAFETIIVLEQGSVLVFKPEEVMFDFIVASTIGIQARASGSLMGVAFETNSQQLHVDCFHENCSIEGISTYPLKAGEHLWMASNGQVGDVNDARYALYGFGGELVPTPTVVVQDTLVKATASATQTLKPLFIPPTLTFTPPPTKTPKPPPTRIPTEIPTDTPEPTDIPEPTEPPEPTETSRRRPPSTDTGNP